MRATRSTAPVVAAQAEGENHVVPRARISFNPGTARILSAELKPRIRALHRARTHCTHTRGTLTAVPSSCIIIQSRDSARAGLARVVVQGLGEATA